MKSSVVYLKTDQNVQVLNKKILLQDVAEIYNAVHVATINPAFIYAGLTCYGSS